MASRLAHWTFRLSVVVFCLAVLVVAFLLITDRFIARQAPQTLAYASHPFRRFVLVPGQSYRSGAVELEINQLGMRGAAPKMPKPDDRFRIFAMGGSSVFDHRLSDSWPERLGQALADLGIAGVESFCAGVPGYSSRETLAFYHDVVGHLDPDLVLLYQGWNDVKYMAAFRGGLDIDMYFKQRDFEKRYAFIYAPRPFRNLHALRQMIYMRARDSEPLGERRSIVDTIRSSDRAARIPSKQPNAQWSESAGMAFWRRNIELFVESVRRDGAIPVLVAQNTLATSDLAPRFREKISYRFVQVDHDDLLEINDAMVRVLAEVAERNDVPFIDLRDRMNGRIGYFTDHVHMTPSGSETFTRMLSLSLLPILSDVGLQPAPGSPRTPHSVLAHWSFDDPEAPGRDFGVLGLDGRILGRLRVLPACRDGGGCLVLPNEGSELMVDSAPRLHLTEEFEISLWVRPKRMESVPRTQGLVVKSGEYHLALRHGRPAFYGYGLDPAGWHVADVRLASDQWQRVVVSLQNRILRLEVDDQTVFEQPVEGSLTPSTRPLRIGGGNGNFLGHLDEVKLSRTW